MDNATVNPDEILRELNDEKAVLMVPVMIYLVVLMVTGTIGNLMVCYYYGWKTRKTTNSLFIIALAVFDLMTCLLSIPIEIMDLRFFYMFTNSGACKVMRFVNHFAANSSTCTLLAISIDRYRRICLPFKKQLNIRQAKIACVISMAVSLVFSWPAFVFYKAVDVTVENEYGIELTGSDCTTIRDESARVYLWVFNGVYFFLFVISTAFLIVMYSFVGRTLYKHNKTRTYGARAVSVHLSSENDTNSTGTDVNSLGDDKNGAENKTEKPADVRNSVFKGSRGDIFSSSAMDSAQNATMRKQTSALDIKTVKYTTIMLSITIVFILSFLPYLVLVIWRTLVGEYEVNFLSDAGIIAFQIGLRSYFLNSALNPLLYGFFNSKFRTFFYKTCCPCCESKSVEINAVSSSS